MSTPPNRFEKFSVLDGRYDLVTQNGQTYLRKEIQLHPSLHRHADELFRLTTAYAADLQRAGVPLPAIAEAASEGSRMTFLCEYRGINLAEHFGTDLATRFFADPSLVRQMLNIVESARTAGLHFDPHLKNFVIEDGTVSYVDFSPPWGPAYYDLRLSVADGEEKSVLEDYFACFRPVMLGFHFASDLLKLELECRSLMPELYTQLLEQGSVTGDYPTFLAEGDRIRERERVRELNGFFLL